MMHTKTDRIAMMLAFALLLVSLPTAAAIGWREVNPNADCSHLTYCIEAREGK